MFQATILYSAQTTKSELTLTDLTFIAAKFTRHTSRLMRWFAGKTEFLAGASMAGLNVCLGVCKITEQAFPADTDGSGYEGGLVLAQMAASRI